VTTLLVCANVRNFDRQDTGTDQGTDQEGLFKGFSSLRSVIFGPPSSITTINPFSFYNCSLLATLDVSTTHLTFLGESALAGTALTSFRAPPSLTAIGRYCFAKCESLTNVDLGTTPATIDIGELAFKNCKVLASLIFPENYYWLPCRQTNLFSGCSCLHDLAGSTKTGDIVHFFTEYVPSEYPQFIPQYNRRPNKNPTPKHCPTGHLDYYVKFGASYTPPPPSSLDSVEVEEEEVEVEEEDEEEGDMTDEVWYHQQQQQQQQHQPQVVEQQMSYQPPPLCPHSAPPLAMPTLNSSGQETKQRVLSDNEVWSMVMAREVQRCAKNWVEADRIRLELR